MSVSITVTVVTWLYCTAEKFPISHRLL